MVEAVLDRRNVTQVSVFFRVFPCFSCFSCFSVFVFLIFLLVKIRFVGCTKTAYH